MTTQTTGTTVRASIEVNAPIDKAFEVFTQDMASWWPSTHHVLRGELAAMVFEPREGGHIYDRATDGTECHWARVLAYDPPNRLVFSWDISTQWAPETDPSKTSEVDVRFTAEGPDRTRVELEHRNIERHGDGWEGMRAAVAAPDGWILTLKGFAERLAR
jgi:uncharacterized protein YndB with AHSA1/START domain